MKILSFRTFLSDWYSFLSVDGKYVLFFKSTAQNSLFFSLFMEKVRQKGKSVLSLDVTHHSLDEIQRTLSATMLGTSSFYWLRMIDELDEKAKKNLLSYCAEYKGPHTIILCLDDLNHDYVSWISVEIPDMIGKEEAILIALLYPHDIPAARVTTLFDHLGSAYVHIPLDTFCMLLQYSVLIGKQDADLVPYIQALITPKQSLFSLSQYLFEKNGPAFYALWHTIGDQHERVFWPSYWSDQVWRAAEFVEKMREGTMTEKSKKELRLPFSFVQKTWRLYTVTELQRAHASIYDLDVRFKRGGQEWLLDFFYVKFLSNCYKI